VAGADAGRGGDGFEHVALDTRWKNPQGKDPETLWQWAQDVVRDLRKGDFLSAGAIAYDNTASGLAATTVQAALDELDGRLDALEALAQGATLIDDGSLSGSSVVLATNIPQTFAKLILRITGMSYDTAARHALLQVSTDNGSNYDTTVGNYGLFAFAGVSAQASLMTGLNHPNAADAENAAVEIGGYQAGMYPRSDGFHRIVGAGINTSWAFYDASTAAINALRLIIGGGAGNFDAGSYALYGVR
jgi:hypothetical protein